MDLRQRFRTLLCCMLLTCASGAAYGDLLSYENLVIEKVNIEIVGTSSTDCSPEAVVSRIHMHEGELFTQNEFDADLKALAAEFDKVEPFIEATDDRLFITLKLWPKPVIRTITWEGNKHYDSKVLKEELGIKVNTTFDRIAFHRGFQKVRGYYVKKGYYQATLEYSVVPVPHSNEIDIVVTIEEGRAGTVKDICFVNFTKEEEEALEEVMYTKKYNIFTSWLTDEGTYHEEAIQQDKFGIVNYLHNRGYADATVDIDVSQPSDSNRITVKITATRGELYTVGQLTIAGNTLFSEEQILKHFAIHQGAPYSPEKIRETQEKIHLLYGKCGYIDAYVSYEPHLELCGPMYSLHFNVDEGEQYRVGMIKVFGNSSTQTKMILHETLLVPGEIFNLEKMHKTEERLENMGFFSSVNVYYVESDGLLKDCGNFRDVHIDVEETNTGKLGAFIGYSTADKLFGGLNLTESNFNYAGLSQIREKGYGALRGGGEYLNVNASIGQRSRRYFVSWTKPYFMDTPWAVGFDIERSNNRYTSKDYEINVWGYSLHATRPINQFWKVVYHYRLRDSDVALGGSVESHRLREEAKYDGIVSAAGVAYIYDSSDHPRQPTKGFKSTISAEGAGLGGDYYFASLAYLNSYYIKVNEKDVIRIRGDLRYILPFGSTTPHSLPLDERLFMGGEAAVRGYRPYRLGPVYPHTDDPSGGVSMQLGSIEYARKFGKTFGGFAFLDAGALTDKRLHMGRIYTSVGLGCRWNVFGDAPLTFGMGFPLNAKHRDQIKRFFINIEGTF